MYGYVLIAHSAWRWATILAGAAVVAHAIWALQTNQLWQPRSAGLGRLFGRVVDIQVLMGALLYFVLSPMTNVAMSVNGVFGGSDVQFFGSKHAMIMVGVLFAVHLSAVCVRRGSTERQRLWRTLICYGITLAVLVLGVPWWRPLIRL